MKSFITALIIFAITIALVIANAIYVDNSAKVLTEAANAMPSLDQLRECGLTDAEKSNQNDEYPEESREQMGEYGINAISHFEETWNQRRNTLELFIVYDYIYNIQSTVDQIKDFFDGEFYTDYATQRKMLLSAIQRLGEVEELTWDSIF